MRHNQSFVRNACALVLGLLVLAGASSAALAEKRETRTYDQGNTACRAWCDKNREGIEREKCVVNCRIYWACHGADQTEADCRYIKKIFPKASAPSTGKVRAPNTGKVRAPNTGTVAPGDPALLTDPSLQTEIGGRIYQRGVEGEQPAEPAEQKTAPASK